LILLVKNLRTILYTIFFPLTHLFYIMCRNFNTCIHVIYLYVILIYYLSKTAFLEKIFPEHDALFLFLYLSLYLREVHRGYRFTLRTMLRSPFQYNTNEAYEATSLLFISYPVHECARA